MLSVAEIHVKLLITHQTFIHCGRGKIGPHKCQNLAVGARIAVHGAE